MSKKIPSVRNALISIHQRIKHFYSNKFQTNKHKRILSLHNSCGGGDEKKHSNKQQCMLFSMCTLVNLK